MLFSIAMILLAFFKFLGKLVAKSGMAMAVVAVPVALALSCVCFKLCAEFLPVISVHALTPSGSLTMQ